MAPSSRRRPAVAGTALLVIGVAVFAAPSVVSGLRIGPDGITPIASVPDDNPQLGLVYQGLTPAKRGTECVGGYEVVARDTCTHGPDEAPPGLDVTRDVDPVAQVTPVPALPRRDVTVAPRERDLAADEGAVDIAGSAPALVPEAAADTAPATPRQGTVPCDGDGVSGKRVQVLYVYEAGTASRYSKYLASFRTWAAGVDAIYDASAKQTGGTRHLRYVTTPDCAVDVPEVQVPAGALGTFKASISALKALGFNRTDRKYMIFADTRVYCGIGTFTGDGTPAATNRNNRGPSYGRSDSGCWSASVAAHELAHNLGAVLNSAPNSSKAGHCTDDYDIMCYRDAEGTVVRVVCPERGKEQRLDCNNDDYYNTKPGPGSFLATHWNVADSDFLIGRAGRPDGDDPGGDPNPKPLPPAPPAPQPKPSTTATPPTSPPPASPTATAPPTRSSPPPPPARPAARLRAIDTTSTSTRLSWPAGPPRARYAVFVDGANIGLTAATRVRVIGLAPNTSYRVQVALRGADGVLRPYAGPAVLRTAPATVPGAGTLFQLTNALTGGTANVYGARGANGTPLVLGRREGVMSEQWQLEAVPGGAFRLRSKITDKCATPFGGLVAGAVVLQLPCVAGDAGQVWRIGKGSAGFTLRAGGGQFVLGVSRLRYGGQRLLVLQRAGNARYQSWTALPV